jgi:mannose-6-phosphate isomerase-like protein (cupin superfamily)
MTPDKTDSRAPAPADSRYNIHLDDKFGHSALIDAGAEAAAHQPWFNQTLTTVNQSLVRLGVFKGEFHWHKHDAEDEFFFVLEGNLLLDIEGQGTVSLAPHQGYTVPKGVVHRTRSPERSVVLMVEADGVVPTGD